MFIIICFSRSMYRLEMINKLFFAIYLRSSALSKTMLMVVWLVNSNNLESKSWFVSLFWLLIMQLA